MEKSKPKRQPKNFLRYFLDEFIFFRREFRYELAIAPEFIADWLRYSRGESNGLWGKPFVNRSVNYANELWHFDLKTIELNKKHGYSQYAEAKGRLLTQNGLTVFEGKVSLGGWINWFFLLAMLVFMLYVAWAIPSPDFADDGGFLLIGISAFSFIGIWLRMYSDRNYLLKIIENAVEVAHEHSTKTKTA